MSFLDKFVYEEDRRIGPGIHRCMIIGAEEGTSAKGKAQIKVRLRISRSPIEINYYLVDNEYMRSNLSRFFDAFPSLRRSTDITRWPGAKGACELEPDSRDDRYLQIRRFTRPDLAGDLPEFEYVEKRQRVETPAWGEYPDEEPPYDYDQLRNPFGNP